jgi:hypothetical protein
MPTSSRPEFPEPVLSHKSGSFTPADRFTTIRRSLLQRSQGRSSTDHGCSSRAARNFGAPLARPLDAPGAILSIDVSGSGASPVAVPADFASSGGQASAAGGRIILYTAQSPPFINGVRNPNAVTNALPPVSLPLGISFNNGFGRPWFANAPNGSSGDGTISVVDPGGFPLNGAPDPVAGGVFTGTITNRNATSIGGLTSAAVATALATKSPDLSIRAVFFAALADGSVQQVHVQKGVDQLVPPGSFTAIWGIGTDAANPRIRTSSRAWG